MHLRELEDVPEFYRLEIHHFFTVYKELEPGKNVHDAAWADRAAEAEVEASRGQLREQGNRARLAVRTAHPLRYRLVGRMGYKRLGLSAHCRQLLARPVRRLFTEDHAPHRCRGRGRGRESRTVP